MADLLSKIQQNINVKIVVKSLQQLDPSTLKMLFDGQDSAM